MAVHTGRYAVSSKVWAMQFVTGLAAETYAIVHHNAYAGIGGLAVQAIASFVKTWHDHGLRKAEILSYDYANKVVASALASQMKPPAAPQG